MSGLLTKLSNKYGCDKSEKKHRYTIRYHEYFEKDRHKNFNYLELGFGIGSSVKMWMEYFTKANLICVDNMEKLPPDKLIQKHVKSGRFEFVSADQIEVNKIIETINKYGKFYIIIDDASHVEEDQQYTLGHLFKFVTPGGWYIIEDLKCKRSHNKKFEVEADKTLQVLRGYLKTNNFHSKVLTSEQNLYLNEQIESVKIYNKKITFIKKREDNDGY